jgi:hypothetical protein
MKESLVRTLSVARLILFYGVVAPVLGVMGSGYAVAQAPTPATAVPPQEIRIANAPIPMRILVQSPAETETELQIICLFRSEPGNTLHGSLVETNEKMKGLLDRIRTPTLFGGELGETLLIAPPAGSLRSKRVLIIGLGDARTFAPARMELVGLIAYREASRLGVTRPFFAPTVIDGGVSGFAPADVAEQVTRGLLRGARTEKVIAYGGVAGVSVIQEFTFLAGALHAGDTERGIEKAIVADATR